MLLVIVLATVGMLGFAGYAWEVSGERRPARSAHERFLVAGGVSLAAAGVALVVVGSGTDIFMLGIAQGRQETFGMGSAAFMTLAMVGPAALVVLGVLAGRGDGWAALSGAGLAGTACLVLPAEALLPVPGFGDPGPTALGPATVGLVPVALLVAGLLRRPVTTGS